MDGEKIKKAKNCIIGTFALGDIFRSSRETRSRSVFFFPVFSSLYK